ncbi:MAG: hypothetical protein LBR12_05430 [Opitutaceae bacterium]|jgi:hypothetical protein|nr:hypothetical protein [Opitutaceae bacterium]
MPDTNTSGVSPEGEPATTATPAAGQGGIGFGTGRGSGLSRGKRGTPPSAAASQPSSAAYQPSGAVQILDAKSEYKNPFAPAAEPPAAAVTEAPAPAEPAAEPPPAPAPAPEAAEPPAPEAAPEAAPEPEASLNILPPAGETRRAQNWENTGAERAVFQKQPDLRRVGGRDANAMRLDSERERRQERRDAASEIERKHREEKPEGFLGWLKNLFAGLFKGAKKEDKNERRDTDDGRREHGGRRRHRHRGGRGDGRQGEPRAEGGRDGQRQERHDGGSRGGHRHRDRGGRGHRQGGSRGHTHRHQGGSRQGGE